ncbi:uncharacterized protein LOC108097985 isoform X1 [Drosophila ficusphila]|uniref:uncharacterized protein LOC108097985 isoform X1 n=1 Tax=Drosophila ficusphila TaxID=30025 RepID=UPI0007E75EE6|nr:uncharacterized protein LOC108097985 isoform X1 [Drosophila ficusphila]XP_017056101.1 uncharacterized protein LOC108097985 isoform X1 [Drosophila ficusphila]
MPSGKQLVRRRRIAVKLQDFLRDDDEQSPIMPSPSQSQVQTAESQLQKSSSIGTIPSNGHLESDVTPIMTPTPQSEDQEKDAAVNLQPTVSAWRLTGENSQPDENYTPDTEQFPELGKRLKRAKQPTPNSEEDVVILAPTPGQRSRGRRGRPYYPVLENFIPKPVLPTVDNNSNKQQSVAKWLDSVRPSDSQPTVNNQANGSPPKSVIILKKNSTPQQTPNGVDQLAQKQQQNPPSDLIHQQQQQQNIAVNPPQLEPQQQKITQNSSHEQKTVGNLTPQQQTSAGNSTPQQLKSPIITLKQQQPNRSEKSPDNTIQQPKKSPNHFNQQLQTSPIQQQQQQKIPPKRPGNSFNQPPKSPVKKALGVYNSSIPVRVDTGLRRQRPTEFTQAGAHSGGGGHEDNDVVPPTPNAQSQRPMSWRIPRRNQNQRSQQWMSQDIWQSSPEGSPEDSTVGSPGEQIVQHQQHQQLQQPGNTPIRDVRQLAMHSRLNSNAKEFRPGQNRATGGANDPEMFQEQPAQIYNRGCRTTRRRRRQRILRSLIAENLRSQAAQNPERRQGLLPTPPIPPNYYGSAPVYQHPVQAAAAPPPPSAAPRPLANQTAMSQLAPLPLIPPETIQMNTSNPPSIVYYNPTTGSVWNDPPAQVAIDIRNRNASQSGFRLASLPCTGVGTLDTDFSIRRLRHSPPHSPLPSSISGPSQFTHTLSSPPMGDRRQAEGVELGEEEEEEEEGEPDASMNQVEPLLYSGPLLDMDREDTQPEQQDPLFSDWGSVWHASQPLLPDEPGGEPSDAIAKDTDPPPDERHKIFRAPVEHDPKPDLNCVPSTIKKLHHLISSQYSDYSFVYALSAQLSQECVPMDCYVYLKMVLLASIVSIEPDEVRAPISLCIIATDGLMTNRLMSKVGQLAPRFLGPHDHGLQPTFSALPARFNWVVASPLLMAQQGVYYAGDWTRLSKEQACQLEKCIENGAVPVTQLQIDQPLEAAVWTHWQPENSNNQTLVLAKLCPIFGLPIYMGDQVSDSLWNLIIQQHSAEGQDVAKDGLNIPEDDMRMLLHLLHQRKTSFTDRAQYMLQKYYVISRKERPNVFSSKTYIVLKQFAESFAKLALRLEVLEADVCVAIFHCEHFVQRIFGAKEHLPPPSVITFNVISRIDPYMNEFARWLLQYLDCYEDEELGMQAAKRRRTDSWSMP